MFIFENLEKVPVRRTGEFHYKMRCCSSTTCYHIA